MTLRVRSSSGQLPWWFGVPFALGGVVVLVFGFVLLQGELRFGSEGVAVIGVVTDTVYYAGGGEDGPSYEVRYQFIDPMTGRSHGGQSDVDESTFDATGTGDAIEVTYIPADPTKSRVGSPDPQLLVPFAVLGGGALFLIVGIGLLLLTRRIRRHGAPAWLQITSAAFDAEDASGDGDDLLASNPFAAFMTGDAAAPRAGVAAVQPEPAPGPADDHKLTEDELSALDGRLAPERPVHPGTESTG